MKKIVLLLFFVTAVISCKKDDDVQPAVTFEDPVFEAYIIKNFDTNNDGKISAKDAAAIEEIYVPEMDITSLKGIEAFVNLTELYCYDNNLNNLDLSKNTALTYLNCFGNKLTVLNVNKNTELEYLNCQSNLFIELDVSKNVKLNQLYCDFNPDLLRLYMFEGQKEGLGRFQYDGQTVITIR